MGALSSVLKKRRKELGLTLLQIADDVGVTEATVLLSPPNSRTTAAHKKSPKALKTNASGAFFIHSYQ